MLWHFMLFPSAVWFPPLLLLTSRQLPTTAITSAHPDLLRSSSLLERCRMGMQEFSVRALPQPLCSLNAACFSCQAANDTLRGFVKPLSLCVLKGRKLLLMFNKTGAKPFSAVSRVGFEGTGVWEIWQARSLLLVAHKN